MMEVTASSAFVDSLATTVILNFNFQVLVNLFFYSAAATTGVLTTSKIIAFLFQEAVKGLSYKWIARCEDRKELLILSPDDLKGLIKKPQNFLTNA